MTESATELADVSNNGTYQTPEQLVAKSIAPVKKEFLRPRPSARTDQNDTVSDTKSAVAKEKKSKRQLKRERLQEKKSGLHLCPQVAKTEDVSSCRYGDKCRLSHDLEAYNAQKPDDLEGQCPFKNGEGEWCPYGLACRFYGTHDVKGGNTTDTVNNSRDRNSEMNVFNKDVQKLLWKNKMKFPKADAVLKSLGLLGPNSFKKKGDDEDVDKACENDSHATNENGCDGEVATDSHATNGNGCDGEVVIDAANKLDCTSEMSTEDNTDGTTTDENRPVKKAKSYVEEKCCSGEDANGTSIPDKDLEAGCPETESKAIADDTLTERDECLKTHPREKKLIDFRGKLYLAPLTTVGNLPFRRVCKVLGADITCGEMAMCTNLLQGQASEWALLRRHSSEDLFGVQICGAYSDTVARTVELIDQECTVDFIDINMGCPIDIVVTKGAGSALLNKPMRMKSIVNSSSSIVDTPITVKVRTGFLEGRNRIHSLIADIGSWGANAVTIHGRSRQQRYSKLADWDYINQCARQAPESFQVLGNGDIFSYTDWNKQKSDCPELSTCMIARGALIKPWIFTEIKEQRHWDIRSGERLDILKEYVQFGFEHWGSDTKGVEAIRHFLLEWLSYTCRYIPVGLLDVIPQKINWRSPSYYGRDDLETLMASDSAADWIRISEMLLGKVPDGFTFSPKHKSNAYDRAENG
ncbi:tRNA-dihydrouridine(47) synthase [NAD(P)(+)]-like [Mercurialis annua]|uniref:tRNA-dihydrouridine(47) synthase [NAD(P)(+)]-like n=1 Tax=Mercurialis annua TaxID=3986 RepID=UPI00215F9D96|nr:tRNA-dihydrouridine(47) synthase [NAD(P)(+)]-like [Mercurialis annua]